MAGVREMNAVNANPAATNAITTAVRARRVSVAGDADWVTTVELLRGPLGDPVSL